MTSSRASTRYLAGFARPDVAELPAGDNESQLLDASPERPPQGYTFDQPIAPLADITPEPPARRDPHDHFDIAADEPASSEWTPDQPLAAPEITPLPAPTSAQPLPAASMPPPAPLSEPAVPVRNQYGSQLPRSAARWPVPAPAPPAPPSQDEHGGSYWFGAVALFIALIHAPIAPLCFVVCGFVTQPRRPKLGLAYIVGGVALLLIQLLRMLAGDTVGADSFTWLYMLLAIAGGVEIVVSKFS